MLRNTCIESPKSPQRSVLKYTNANMPILRVDFYGEDKLQGPKQLFLYIIQEDSARDRAYKQMTSLLQGVKVRKIDSVKELNELCRTVRENYAPPSK